MIHSIDGHDSGWWFFTTEFQKNKKKNSSSVGMMKHIRMDSHKIDGNQTAKQFLCFSLCLSGWWLGYPSEK